VPDASALPDQSNGPPRPAVVEAQLATLCAALEVQFERIAQMQAELDVGPQARQRRNILRGLLANAPGVVRLWRCNYATLGVHKSTDVAR